MLRECMATETLVEVYAKLNKAVTNDNVASLCATACQAPELFFTPAVCTPDNPIDTYMAKDIGRTFCKVRGIIWYHPYARLVEDTLLKYTKVEFADVATLQLIFDAIDDIISRIDLMLAVEHFPPLR